MIRSFSTLYAGHVLAGDGVGFHGTPAADRLLSFPIGATLSQFKEQLTYFAHEVIPAFKKTTVGV